MGYTIGECYLVPTVNGNAVLLPGHKDYDPCIHNGETFHYHRDYRFIDEEPNMFVVEGGDVKYTTKTCLREHPAHPGMMFFYLNWLLERKNSVVIGGRCPHQGVNVSENGQCPAHGLHFKGNRLRFKIEDAQFAVNEAHNIVAGVYKPNTLTLEMNKTLDVKSIFVVFEDFVACKATLKTPVPVCAGDTLNYNGECHVKTRSVA